jgi:hypothetical protein
MEQVKVRENFCGPSRRRFLHSEEESINTVVLFRIRLYDLCFHVGEIRIFSQGGFFFAYRIAYRFAIGTHVTTP